MIVEQEIPNHHSGMDKSTVAFQFESRNVSSPRIKLNNLNYNWIIEVYLSIDVNGYVQRVLAFVQDYFWINGMHSVGKGGSPIEACFARSVITEVGYNLTIGSALKGDRGMCH